MEQTNPAVKNVIYTDGHGHHGGLFGGYNNGNYDHSMELSHQLGDIRHSLKDSEANIRSDVRQEGQEGVMATKEVETTVREAQCDIEKEVISSRHILDKSIQESKYESKIATLESTGKIIEKVDLESDRINDKVENFERRTEKNFCEVNDNIKALRTQALEDKVDFLREELQTAKLSQLICCGCPSTDSGHGNSGK